MTTAFHESDETVQTTIGWIYQRFGYDFRNYSLASFKRRLVHAMRQFGVPNLALLREKIERRPELFDDLMQSLTVPVSEMFRDPEYFLSLRKNVIPILRTYPSLKIWIAGCSTGQEAYSMAILLHEEQLLDRTILYATDINPITLQRAREGIFPIDALRAFTRNYQEAGGKQAFSDYYTAAYGSVVFKQFLQNKITFADHSLATDAVFAEVNLVSCRNVLIYFNRALQDRAFDLFSQSLCRQGFLGLGKKETVQFSQAAPLFDDFDKPNRIFRKKLMLG